VIPLPRITRSAFDLLDDSFPHGTVDGYRQGCKTNHCPAPVSCTLVDRWARSDIRFHRLVTEGATGDQLAAWLGAQHQVEVASDRPVKKPKPRKPKASPKPRVNNSPHLWEDTQVERMKELHTLGWTDKQIGEDIGRPQWSVFEKRKRLGIAANPRKKKAAA
jgi:hypothetical protein